MLNSSWGPIIDFHHYILRSVVTMSIPHSWMSITCSGVHCLSFVNTWVHLRLLVGSVLLILLAFYVVLFGLFVFGLCLVLDVASVVWLCPFSIAHSVFSNVYLLLSDLFFQFC